MKSLDEKELFALIESELDGSEEFADDEANTEKVFFSSDKEDSIDKSLGLKMISIRLQNGLIDDLKAIGQLDGIGYQPLIKQVLTRFVTVEKKKRHNDAVALKAKAQRLKELQRQIEKAKNELEQIELEETNDFTVKKVVGG